MTDSSNIEDIFRLTELQEAMFVHRMQHKGFDPGTLLVRCTLIGDLDVDRFREAWQRTTANHQATRSSIHWKDLSHPVQVVSREVKIELDFVDCTNISSEERANCLLRLEDSLRDRGLDISTAPVQRLALVRISNQEHRLLWICHHIFLDGWSSALLLNEVVRRYDALARGISLNEKDSPLLGDWVAWLRKKDPVDPSEFWKIQRFQHATPLAQEGWYEFSDQDPANTIEKDASTSLSGVEALARRWRISPASFLLGCWGLTIAEMTGANSTVFGFTASGRSADFDGIERLVGLMSNTLPFTVEIDRNASIESWFRGVASSQHQVLHFERCSIGSLLRAGGLIPRRPLFDTLLTFANFPIQSSSKPPQADDQSLKICDFNSDVTSGYPLTLAIVPKSTLCLRAHYFPKALREREVQEIVDRFDEIIRATVTEQSSTVGDVIKIDSSRKHTSSTAPRPRRSHTDNQPAPDVPSTDREIQLARIWISLLETGNIGLDESFFDLGGDSILLLRMIERVRQDFGVELPLGVVVESPSVRAIAKAIDAEHPACTWSSLVPIRKGGKRPPIYFVHSLGGEIAKYYSLANHLPSDQPVYGIQPPPEKLATVASIASRYLEEVRAQHAGGPYRFGGFCFGGMVAFEMARQLSSEGELVDLIVLLDCLAPGPQFLHQKTVMLSAKSLVDIFLDDPVRFATLATKRIIRSTKRLGRRLHRPGALLELSDVSDLGSIPMVYREPSMRHFRAVGSYNPDSWDGDVVLVRTVDARYTEDLGWKDFINGKVSVHYTIGTHANAFDEPYVQEMGKIIAKCFDELAVRQNQAVERSANGSRLDDATGRTLPSCSRVCAGSLER